MSSDFEVNPALPPFEEIDPAVDSSLIDEVPAVVKPAKHPRPWGFWMTIVWTVICLIATFMIQLVVALALLVVASARDSTVTLESSVQSGTSLAAATVASTPALVGLMALLVWARRYPIRDYLALSWPDARSVRVSLVELGIVLVASDLTTYALGRPVVPQFMVDIYRTSWLPFLLLAIVVMAPVSEETLFRGFFYKGIACSRVGPVVAILLSTIFFASLHIQYDLWGIFCVAVIGLYLGFVRYWTGSMLLTMLLHGVANAFATGELIVQEHWLK